MRRKQAFEFGDLAVTPLWVRSGIQNFLNGSHRVCRFYRHWTPKIAELIQSGQASRIVDLCSGGGFLAALVVRDLRERIGVSVTAVVTDLHPNARAAAALAASGDVPVEYRLASVDATRVPPDLTGIRTVFNGFHHFPPSLAQGILRDAQHQRQPICVFEYNRNTWLAIFSALFYPLLVLALTPFARPLNWKQIVFTYLLPLFPLVIGWDGFASNLRCYSLPEFAQMTDPLRDDGYQWEMGIIRTPSYPIGFTYLIGRPVADGAVRN